MENVIKISKKTISENYSIIRKEGTFKVQAGANNPYYNEKLGKDTYIVNLRAIDEKNIQKVLDLFKDREEIPVTELNGLTMSMNIIVNEGRTPVVPMKGQIITVNIGKVMTKNSGEVLAITNHLVPAPASAEKFSFGDVRPETTKSVSGVKIGEESKVKETIKA